MKHTNVDELELFQLRTEVIGKHGILLNEESKLHYITFYGGKGNAYKKTDCCQSRRK